MQRERQANGRAVGDQALDAGKPADGRDRGAAVRDAQVGQPLARGQHGVEVHQRLAHPHEDGVVDRLEAAEVKRLVEDLRLGEVAPEAHAAGRAEGARERAARLAREAEGPATVAIPHEDRLDGLAVVCSE